jgi:hypothetical protein
MPSAFTLMMQTLMMQTLMMQTLMMQTLATSNCCVTCCFQVDSSPQVAQVQARVQSTATYIVNSCLPVDIIDAPKHISVVPAVKQAVHTHQFHHNLASSQYAATMHTLLSCVLQSCYCST